MAENKNKYTFGTFAVAMFWLVIVSGILLAVPFDVSAPYLSLSNILTGNLWASLVRNIHFWSSQFFLILSLIHLYDHFHYMENIGLKPGMSVRLSFGVLIIFMAMITGFLLKGDANSLQARQILNSLISYIPFFGESVAFSLLGNPESFQLIYVHHIATFTIFIGVIMVEHSRRIWARPGDFIYSAVVVFGLSIFFSAPLHDNVNPTVKGPWYFVGFQEVLHWLRHPGWSLLLFLSILVLIYIVNSGKDKAVFVSKRILLFITAVYLLLTITGLFFRGDRWRLIFPWESGYSYSVLHDFKTMKVVFSPEFEIKDIANLPLMQGRKEACLACHIKTEGFTDSHKPGAIGCFSCHGGNPFATSKKQAHRNMTLIPGNLATAPQTCGTTQCHPDIVQRVPTGLMSTLSGLISVDRFVFNEQTSPDLLSNVHQLKNSAADEHLRNLCVQCHLGNPKTKTGAFDEFSRGGGCLACHLNYSAEAEKEQAENPGKIHRLHPSISLKVSNNRCFNCHSRSGRIATNYEGWHETTLQASQMPDSTNYRLIEKSRVFIKKQDDVHHQLGLECIDCHHSYELMGDGKYYAHEEDQQDVQCADCHVPGKPVTVTARELDNESAIIAALRFGDIKDRKFLATQKHKHPLINTYIENDSIFFLTKNGGKKMKMKTPAEVCARTKAHSNISCCACHSSWAPTCIGCHNSFDKNEPGYDMMKNLDKKGSWVEYIGDFHAKLLTLGNRKTVDKQEIIPVVPGMILTIDKKSFSKSAGDSLIFHRLYAPAAPHTTAAKGRSCKSCHNEPVALGFGDGKLSYIIDAGKGTWKFEPMFENDKNDQLPADAWTGFLQTRKGTVSTRTNVTPFTREQQQKILTVGACLTCHDENSVLMKRSLNEFEVLLKSRNSKCILPDWKN